jgi:hypothetical protein
MNKNLEKTTLFPNHFFLPTRGIEPLSSNFFAYEMFVSAA